jgi:hypothetical protein
MGPLETIGFISFLLAASFLIGFGMMVGVWAGIKFGSYLLGPLNVNLGPIVVKGP